jgi:hypothetical protein
MSIGSSHVRVAGIALLAGLAVSQPSFGRGLSGSLVAGSSGVSSAVSLPISTMDTALMRMRKRPELLYAEWDNSMIESITEIEHNPLYQSSSVENNPLFNTESLIVSGGAGTLSYLHHEGVIHRDIAARFYVTIPGSSTPIAMADLTFSLPDINVLDSATDPDVADLLGDWNGTQVGTASFTYLDGSPLEHPMTFEGGTWSFTVVPTPSAAMTLGLAGVMAGRRKR